MSAAPRTLPDQDELGRRLAELWDRHGPTNAARVRVLNDAAAQFAAGARDAATTERALQAAHQLAGSLGTFGYDDGTRLAREAERLLREPAGDPRELASTVEALRDIVAQRPAERPATSNPAEDGLPAPSLALLVSDDATLTPRLAAAATQAGVALEVTPTENLADRLEQTCAGAVVIDVASASEGPALIRAIAARRPAADIVALTPTDTLADCVALVEAGAVVCVDRDTSPGRVVELSVHRGAPRPTARTTILAVDDDPLVLDGLDVLLADPDRRLVRTASAEAFWEAFQRIRPEIVLVDLNLPGIGGLDLCRAIRAEHHMPRVSVLVLTAETESETVRAAFSAGADDYVAKPVVGPELEARVTAHAERARLLRELTETDQLSGLDNRRRAEQAIDNFIRMASRRGAAVAVAMIDLDHFKRVNDDYGHAAGDTALRSTAALLRDSLRGEDVVARWGGEEFLVGMYGSSAADAAERITRVLEIMRARPVRTAEGDEFTLTFSAGIAAYPDDAETIDDLWRTADRELYRAKVRRNCVVCTGDEQP